MKASAYLCVFDDWELLDASLAAIEPYVDEIVVVDGAYTWIAGLIGRGRDAVRSVDAVYDVLRRFEPKLRVITGIWENELQKRMAGYRACRHRYIFRVDADEVLFIDPVQLERFAASDRAVGEMEMPIYMAPGLIRAAGADSAIERQALLFDASKIDARRHLDHLWLLLPPAEDAVRRRPERDLVYPEPIAFNAHLTHWRTPASSISRARFYVVNYIRGTGDVSWLAALRRTPDETYETLLARVDPQAAEDFLLGHAIVAAPADLNGFMLRRSPLSALQEAGFGHLYVGLLEGLARCNQGLSAVPRHIICGMDYNIDLSTPAAVAPFVAGGKFELRVERPVAAVRAGVVSVDEDGRCDGRDIPVEISGTTVALDFEPAPAALRQTLKLAIWNRDGSVFNRFWVG